MQRSEAGKGSNRRKTQVLQVIADLRHEYCFTKDKARKKEILKEIEALNRD